MHEVHLVRALVAAVEQQAAAQGAKRVTRLTVKFNPLISHSGDHVQFCFDMVKQESALLKDAALTLIELPGQVRCMACQHQFETGELPGLCPNCGSPQLEPVDRTGVTLETFEIEK